jgi:hypothetical protein
MDLFPNCILKYYKNFVDHVTKMYLEIIEIDILTEGKKIWSFISKNK